MAYGVWGINFTSAGGMSPFYQAREGGPMNRFVMVGIRDKELVFRVRV